MLREKAEALEEINTRRRALRVLLELLIIWLSPERSISRSPRARAA